MTHRPACTHQSNVSVSISGYILENCGHSYKSIGLKAGNNSRTVTIAATHYAVYYTRTEIATLKQKAAFAALSYGTRICEAAYFRLLWLCFYCLFGVRQSPSYGSHKSNSQTSEGNHLYILRTPRKEIRAGL